MKSRKRWWLAGYVCMMQLRCAVQHDREEGCIYMEEDEASQA